TNNVAIVPNNTITKAEINIPFPPYRRKKLAISEPVKYSIVIRRMYITICSHIVPSFTYGKWKKCSRLPQPFVLFSITEKIYSKTAKIVLEIKPIITLPVKKSILLTDSPIAKGNKCAIDKIPKTNI